MHSSMSTRRRIVASIIAMLVVAAVVAVTPSAANAADQHCSMTIIGQKKSGQFVTTPMTCGAAGGFSILSTIAIHYTGANGTGSSLNVFGGACNGGWLNMPAGWQNVISSTWSLCATEHFDGDNLNGVSQSLGPGLGNLVSLNDRTNSVRYT